MNNKGFLLGEETLKIILAVISIGFLVYFLGALYYNSVKDKDLDLAKASLEHLIDEINAGVAEIEIYNPEKWVVLSWSDPTIHPDKCIDEEWENCLCICKGYVKSTATENSVYKYSEEAKEYSDKCKDKGVCLETNKKISFEGNFVKIEKPPVVVRVK
jgi:hypothetical protein